MGRSVIIIILVWIVVGCENVTAPPSSSVYEPIVAGVVASVSELDGGGMGVTLENGDSVELASNPVVLYGGLPTPGELLLIAPNGPSQAYAVLGQRTAECFNLVVPAVEGADVIVFDSRFSLPKASGFDPGPVRNGEFPSVGEGFCVNPAGEVTRYGN